VNNSSSIKEAFHGGGNILDFLVRGFSNISGEFKSLVFIITFIDFPKLILIVLASDFENISRSVKVLSDSEPSFFIEFHFRIWHKFIKQRNYTFLQSSKNNSFGGTHIRFWRPLPLSSLIWSTPYLVSVSRVLIF
jgi:hypothetical protein